MPCSHRLELSSSLPTRCRDHPPFEFPQNVNLAAATFAYPRVPNSQRADLAQTLIQTDRPPGVYLLSTCLRVEVAVPGDRRDLQAALDALLPGHEIEPVYREGEAVLVHLYRVAAGLDSPIVGEKEILTQFRKALQEAESRDLDGMFAKALQGAVAAARLVHQALPRRAQDSIAAVAAAAVAQQDRVAVLGAGVTATSVVEHLIKLDDPPQVTMIARNPERISLPGVSVWPFHRAAEAILEMPAVVSATSAKRRLLPPERLAELIAGRRMPIKIVDMAMPPDFNPPDGSDLEYLDIDDLARLAEPQPRVAEADELACQAAVEMFHRARAHSDVGPVIGSMMQLADGIVDEVVARFGGRISVDADVEVLRQAAHTVARRILSGPVSYMKGSDATDEAIEAVADAFGVEI